MLVPNKMQHIICTGNLCSQEQVDYLSSIAPNVHIVRGDFDTDMPDLPETKVVTIGSFKIGICHGHQVVPWGDHESLAVLQRQLGCDILVTGHTHKSDVTAYAGKWFINPGSITGAASCLGSESVPTFVLMSIKDKQVTTYTYEVRDGKTQVYQDKFSKS